MALLNMLNTTNDLEIAAKTFNKIAGKISKDEAESILFELNLNKKAFKNVSQILNKIYEEEMTVKLVDKEIIVSQIKAKLASYGVVNIN